MNNQHVCSTAEGTSLHTTVLADAMLDTEVCMIIADHIEDELSDRYPSCVLDLGNVRFVSSVGLGALVRLHNACRRLGGRLALVNVDHEVVEALKLARLDRLFKIAPSPREAARLVG